VIRFSNETIQNFARKQVNRQNRDSIAAVLVSEFAEYSFILLLMMLVLKEVVVLNMPIVEK
jgi:hypothetical protein